jgi:hypothetical protein
MKLASSDRSIDRISTQPERKFTIKATGKAFRILSSGLYKDKILAIIRELSANAHDAHISAKCPQRPFEVHLPNTIEPWFSVRDYGPSLSPYQMETVFTTYFESTKSESNDEVGGLGLGCKSPLSYVDSFTVISRHEGVKRTYTVFFDEDDTPSIIQMAAAEIPEWSDDFEPSGLEVSLPVRHFDFTSFQTKAQKVFRYYEVQPKIFGVADFKPDKSIPLLVGPGYVIHRANEAMAVMGIIGYPVDSTAITTTPSGLMLLNSPIDLLFNVGDLDITAGREELSYDQPTKDALAIRVDQVLADLPARVMRKFRQCKTEYEARNLYGKLVETRPFISGMFHNKAIPFKGMLINRTEFLPPLIGGNTFLHFDAYKARYKTHDHYSHLSQNSGRTPFTIPAGDDLVIIVDDNRGATMVSRIKEFRLQNPSADIWVQRAAPENLELFSKMFEGVKTYKLSELPRSPMLPRSKTMIRRVSSHYRAHGGMTTKDWSAITVNMADGGVYVPMISSVPADAGVPMSNFGVVYKQIINLGLFDTSNELYGVPKTLMKNFVGEPQWINFFDLVRTNYRAKMDAEQWIDNMARFHSKERLSSVAAKLVNERNNFKMACQPLGDHPLNDFLTIWKSCDVGRDYTTHVNIASHLKIDEMLSVGQSHDLQGMWREHERNYPMLKYVLKAGYDGGTASLRDTTSYIMTMDRTNCLTDPS